MAYGIMVRCCVPGCNVRAMPGIKMHVLPHNFERRRKWCEAINRPDLIDIEEYHRRNVIRICNNHFPDKDKVDYSNVRSKLKFDAFPSIVPGLSFKGLIPVETLGDASEKDPSVDLSVTPPKPADEKPAEVDNFVESLIISDEGDLNVEDELQKRHLAELERLYGEIGNLTKKTEQQEQTICKIKALNKSLAKDLHEERHENLYLKHQVNSLKKKMLEMSHQSCLASGITSYIGNGIHNSQNELILIVTDDDP